MRGVYVEGHQPIWVDVRCPRCLEVIGARQATMWGSDQDLIRAHASECRQYPRGVVPVLS